MTLVWFSVGVITLKGICGVTIGLQVDIFDLDIKRTAL